MKNFIVSLLVLSSMSALTAVAAEDLSHSPGSHCDRLLALSDSQKLEIKELKKASEAKLAQLKADIRKASIDAELVLSKVEATKQEAALAAEVLLAKESEVDAVKKAAKLAELFDVLTPEQRLKKVKCERAPRPAHRPGQHSRGGSHGRYDRYPSRPYRPGPVVYRPGSVVVRPAPGRPHYRPSRPTHIPTRGGRVYPQI